MSALNGPRAGGMPGGFSRIWCQGRVGLAGAVEQRPEWGNELFRYGGGGAEALRSTAGLEQVPPD